MHANIINQNFIIFILFYKKTNNYIYNKDSFVLKYKKSYI